MQSSNNEGLTRSKKMDDPIWSLLVNTSNQSLIVDCRNETNKSVELQEMSMITLDCSMIKTELSWWERLISADEHYLYTVKYKDQHDPTHHQFHQIDLRSGSKSEVKELPSIDALATESHVYEPESAYHTLVADFLGLELPLSCEYLELDNYIIISYYLRSENDFDRFLLLLKDGKKELKVHQDRSMKGFSPGAFFVYDNQLIFIKDRNEVCIHPL